VTFSISACCGETRRLAIAIASSSPAVGARCAHLRAGVGAVSSQNITDPRLGTRALELMALGVPPGTIVHAFRDTVPDIEYRQLAMVNAAGETACFSGKHSLGIHAAAEGRLAVAAGNLLASPAVPQSMLSRFELTARDELGDRVVQAMQVGLEAGGEAGPIRSAALVMVADVPWPIADLRIDWHDDPIGELARLWAIWRPQMQDYVTRALDPRSAPSFGVPGDVRQASL
jgi:uncharacterized Ntn-hydrolase superfamily protein